MSCVPWGWQPLVIHAYLLGPLDNLSFLLHAFVQWKCSVQSRWNILLLKGQLNPVWSSYWMIHWNNKQWVGLEKALLEERYYHTSGNICKNPLQNPKRSCKIKPVRAEIGAERAGRKRKEQEEQPCSWPGEHDEERALGGLLLSHGSLGPLHLSLSQLLPPSIPPPAARIRQICAQWLFRGSPLIPFLVLPNENGMGRSQAAVNKLISISSF